MVLSELPEVQSRLTITGSATSPGITMAKAFRLQAGKMKFDENASDAQAETRLFKSALSEAGQQLDELKEKMSEIADKLEPGDMWSLEAEEALFEKFWSEAS